MKLTFLMAAIISAVTAFADPLPVPTDNWSVAGEWCAKNAKPVPGAACGACCIEQAKAAGLTGDTYLQFYRQCDHVCYERGLGLDPYRNRTCCQITTVEWGGTQGCSPRG